MQTRVVSARKKRTDAEPLFLTFLFYGRKKIKWAVVDRGYGAQASSNSTLRAKAAADNAAVTECLRSEVDEKNSHAHAMTLNKPVQQKSQVTAIFLSSKGGIFQNALRTRRKMRKKKRNHKGETLSLSVIFFPRLSVTTPRVVILSTACSIGASIHFSTTLEMRYCQNKTNPPSVVVVAAAAVADAGGDVDDVADEVVPGGMMTHDSVEELA